MQKYVKYILSAIAVLGIVMSVACDQIGGGKKQGLSGFRGQFNDFFNSYLNALTSSLKNTDTNQIYKSAKLILDTI